MEQIKFSQAQINELYEFAVEYRSHHGKQSGRALPKVPAHVIPGTPPVDHTEQELFDFARNFNPKTFEAIFSPLTTVIENESIIFMQEGDDEDDFTDLPRNPQHAVLAAQLMLFLINYGVNNVMAESLRLARVRAEAMAKLTPEEIAVLGL